MTNWPANRADPPVRSSAISSMVLPSRVTADSTPALFEKWPDISLDPARSQKLPNAVLASTRLIVICKRWLGTTFKQTDFLKPLCCYTRNGLRKLQSFPMLWLHYWKLELRTGDMLILTWWCYHIKYRLEFS
jgi:hypothetical protein